MTPLAEVCRPRPRYFSASLVAADQKHDSSLDIRSPVDILKLVLKLKVHKSILRRANGRRSEQGKEGKQKQCESDREDPPLLCRWALLWGALLARPGHRLLVVPLQRFSQDQVILLAA